MGRTSELPLKGALATLLGSVALLCFICFFIRKEDEKAQEDPVVRPAITAHPSPAGEAALSPTQSRHSQLGWHKGLAAGTERQSQAQVRGWHLPGWPPKASLPLGALVRTCGPGVCTSGGFDRADAPCLVWTGSACHHESTPGS